jgi:hypothetical protein
MFTTRRLRLAKVRAGEDEGNVAASAPLPARPAASKPAEAKEKPVVEGVGPMVVMRGVLQGITVIGSGWRKPNTCRSGASRR